jgi:hypothetical protein
MMKYTDHIVIERPLEKVFLWMFQPQHIVQLVTLDYTKFTDDKRLAGDKPVPPHLVAEADMWLRFREQAEAELEIQDLSTPTLQVGTTFRYGTGVRNKSEKFSEEFPRFPAWKPLYAGFITIKKSSLPALFEFTQRSFSPSVFEFTKFPSSVNREKFSPSTIQRQLLPFANYRLAFQAQQEKTIITYTRSTGSGKIGSMIATAVVPAFAVLGEEIVRQQFMRIKIQMEDEIDEV